MRILVAALAIALMTVSAYAQSGFGGHGGGKKAEKTQKAEPKPKVDDKAYNAALKGLPDKKFDPWGGVR